MFNTVICTCVILQFDTRLRRLQSILLVLLKLKHILCCLSPGWLLNVYPADAHCGPDFSVNTEPDDGVSSTLQPLL